MRRSFQIVIKLTYLCVVWAENVCEEENDKNCEDKGYFQPRHVDAPKVLEDLEVDIEDIKKSCGEVCETREALERVIGEGVWSRELVKMVDCEALFKNEKIDANSKLIKPLKKIPHFLLEDFTYQGRVPVDYRMYFDESSHDESGQVVWTEKLIEDMMSSYKKGNLMAGGMYFPRDVSNIWRHLREEVGGVDGKHALVIGTQRPWIESLLLLEGAASVTTLEYHEIKSEHPKVRAITPKVMSEEFLKGTLPSFDLMVSFSSVEHSGFGRYGDQLNPWGDLITMARAWCVVKPGGRAMVGVPVFTEEKLKFNGARFYGKVLLPHLFANWQQVHTEMDLRNVSKDCDWCYQPLFVAKKRIEAP